MELTQKVHFDFSGKSSLNFIKTTGYVSSINVSVDAALKFELLCDSLTIGWVYWNRNSISGNCWLVKLCVNHLYKITWLLSNWFSRFFQCHCRTLFKDKVPRKRLRIANFIDYLRPKQEVVGLLLRNKRASLKLQCLLSFHQGFGQLFTFEKLREKQLLPLSLTTQVWWVEIAKKCMIFRFNLLIKFFFFQNIQLNSSKGRFFLDIHSQFPQSNCHDLFHPGLNQQFRFCIGRFKTNVFFSPSLWEFARPNLLNLGLCMVLICSRNFFNSYRLHFFMKSSIDNFQLVKNVDMKNISFTALSRNLIGWEKQK